MTNLDATLGQLDAAQLVRHAGEEVEPTYMFKHTLTQETTYQSLLHTKRRAIHRRVADSIERLYPERLDEFAARLAQHYAEAGDDAKTFEYALRAGDNAARLYAHAEAIAHYSLALRVAAHAGATDAQLAHLYLQRGRMLELGGQYQDAMDSYDALIALGTARHARELELAALIAKTRLYSTHSPFFDAARAEELSHQALTLARELGDRAAEANLLWTLMIQSVYSGSGSRDDLKYGEQSLALARELDLREQMAFTLNDLFWVYLKNGQLEQARAARDEAVLYWRELDNKPMLADALSGLALIDMMLGVPEKGIARADQAAALAFEIGNAWGRAQAFSMKGYNLAELGRVSELLEAFQEGLRAAQLAQSFGSILVTRCQLGWWHAQLGDIEPALAFARQAFEISNGALESWQPWSIALFTRIHVLQGQLDQAERYARTLTEPKREYFRRLFPPAAAEVALADAEWAFARGDYPRVLALADESLDLIYNSARNWTPDLLYLQARAHIALGASERAYEILQHARARYSYSRRMMWRILRALGELERARGNIAEAEALHHQAQEIIQFIAEHTPGAYRETFLRRANGPI